MCKYKKINKQKVRINFSTTELLKQGVHTFVACTEHAETHEFKAGSGYGRFFRDHIYSSELPQLKLPFIYTSLVYTLKS